MLVWCRPRSGNALASKPEHCMIDWLHTVDQGIGQDALGQLFFEALQQLPGENQHARLRLLWGRIKQCYQYALVPSKLDKLTLEIVKKQGQAAKLSSKAAEARGLYIFGLRLAKELASPGDEHGRTTVALFTLFSTRWWTLWRWSPWT